MSQNLKAAVIIPVMPKKYVVIREWRVPLQAYSIGWPAGLVGDHENETIETAASRELIEELGRELIAPYEQPEY